MAERPIRNKSHYRASHELMLRKIREENERREMGMQEINANPTKTYRRRIDELTKAIRNLSATGTKPSYVDEGWY